MRQIAHWKINRYTHGRQQLNGQQVPAKNRDNKPRSAGPLISIIVSIANLLKEMEKGSAYHNEASG